MVITFDPETNIGELATGRKFTEAQTNWVNSLSAGPEEIPGLVEMIKGVIISESTTLTPIPDETLERRIKGGNLRILDINEDGVRKPAGFIFVLPSPLSLIDDNRLRLTTEYVAPEFRNDSIRMTSPNGQDKQVSVAEYMFSKVVEENPDCDLFFDTEIDAMAIAAMQNGFEEMKGIETQKAFLRYWGAQLEHFRANPSGFVGGAADQKISGHESATDDKRQTDPWAAGKYRTFHRKADKYYIPPTGFPF